MFEFGKVLYGFVDKVGFSWIVFLNNAFIDMYFRCGDVLLVRLVFESMVEKKSIVFWILMIVGLVMYGYGEEVIRFFNEMIEFGVIFDKIFFVSFLYVCSYVGLIREGEDYFFKMKRVYNIELEIEYYGCMVDLYG